MSEDEKIKMIVILSGLTLVSCVIYKVVRCFC